MPLAQWTRQNLYARFTGVVSESVALSDSDAALFNAKVTGQAETVTLAEARASVYNAKTTPVETVSLAESRVAIYNAKATGQSETVALTESRVALYNAKTTPVETVALTESRVALYNAKTTPVETVALTESRVAIYNAKTTPVETVALAETRNSIYGAKPTPVETVSLTESKVSKFVGLQPITEAVTLTEARATIYNAKATGQIETVTLTEARSSHYAAVASATETVSVSESLAARKKFLLALSSSTTLSESVASLFRGLVTTTETTSISESVVGAEKYTALLASSVALSEAISQHLIYLGDFGDSIPVAGAFKKVSHKTHASVSESVSLSEQTSLRDGYDLTVNNTESLTLSEAKSTVHATRENFSETLSTAESFSSLRRAHQTQTETVSVSETTAANIGSRRFETVPLVENLVAIFARSVETVVDTVNLTFPAAPAMDSLSTLPLGSPLRVQVANLIRSRLAQGSATASATHEADTLVRLSCVFRGTDGAPIDPDTVRATVTKADGTSVPYLFDLSPSNPLKKDSAGVYHVDVHVDVMGAWFCSWESTGYGSASAKASFNVTLPSL